MIQSPRPLGYCCLHAGFTVENWVQLWEEDSWENWVLHTQDQMGIVVSRQVHPIECQVCLRSARPAGPAPLRRPNPAAGYQAGRLPRKTFSDNLKTPGLAASPSLVLAASCKSFFRRISVIQTSSEQLPNKAYIYIYIDSRGGGGEDDPINIQTSSKHYPNIIRTASKQGFYI